jgi:beta-lactamase class D
MPFLMMRAVATCAFFLLLSLSGASQAQALTLTPPEGVRNVVFMAHNLGAGEVFTLGDEGLNQRHAPYSTFKIPNFLIALEHGAIADATTVIPWNPDRRPVRAWWPAGWQTSQDLNTAFRRSTVWAFQDLALQVGGDQYRSILAQWRYGNAHLSGDSDQFWLDGELQISVREQVDFMQRLVSGDLDIAPEHLEALWQASRQLEGAAGVLHAKTGSGPLEPGNMDGPFAGWYVGAIRQDAHPGVVFALYAEADRYRDLAQYRAEASLELLQQAGLWATP